MIKASDVSYREVDESHDESTSRIEFQNGDRVYRDEDHISKEDSMMDDNSLIVDQNQFRDDSDVHIDMDRDGGQTNGSGDQEEDSKLAKRGVTNRLISCQGCSRVFIINGSISVCLSDRVFVAIIICKLIHFYM